MQLTSRNRFTCTTNPTLLKKFFGQGSQGIVTAIGPIQSMRFGGQSSIIISHTLCRRGGGSLSGSDVRTSGGWGRDSLFLGSPPALEERGWAGVIDAAFLASPQPSPHEGEGVAQIKLECESDRTSNGPKASAFDPFPYPAFERSPRPARFHPRKPMRLEVTRRQLGVKRTGGRWPGSEAGTCPNGRI